MNKKSVQGSPLPIYDLFHRDYYYILQLDYCLRQKVEQVQKGLSLNGRIVKEYFHIMK